MDLDIEELYNLKEKNNKVIIELNCSKGTLVTNRTTSQIYVNENGHIRKQILDKEIITQVEIRKDETIIHVKRYFDRWSSKISLLKYNRLSKYDDLGPISAAFNLWGPELWALAEIEKRYLSMNNNGFD